MKRKIYILSIAMTLIIIVIIVFSKNRFVNLFQDEIPEMPIKEYTQVDVENLALLCKVWGFMKYYHPAVRDGKYDWDRELLYVMPSLVSVSSKEKRNEILSKWVDEFDVRMKPSKKTISISADSVKMYPDLNWIEDATALGMELSGQLKKIAGAERDTTNYYVRLVKNERGLGYENAVFEQEEAYPQCTFPTISYQLLSLFRFWNAIQYYYPYKYLLKSDWGNILENHIPLFLKITDRVDYENALKRFSAEVCDAHTWILGGKNKEYMIPVMVRFIEGKAVVIRYSDLKSDYRGGDSTLQPGDVLIRINSEPVDSLVKRTAPYISASNEATLLRDIASREFLLSNDTIVYVDFERNGILVKAKLRSIPRQSVKPMADYQTSQPLTTALPSDILYLWLGSSLGGKVPDEINAKGMIIDLRGYPSQGKTEGYLQYKALYPSSTGYAMCTYGSSQYPGLFTYTPIIKEGKENKSYYKGKKVILVNELTQSHAEYMTMKYRCTPNTIVVGSMTAGADGNLSVIALPGNLRATFSGVGVYYPNKTETQQVGIVPDIEVENTIQGIREGRDEVLEAAINYLNN